MSAGPAAGAARSVPVRLIVVAVGLLLAAVVLVLVVRTGADEPSGATGREVVEAVLADDPEAPVVLPVTVPRGYALAAGERARGVAGKDSVAAWVFEPVQERSGLAVVKLYVQEPGRIQAPPDGVLARRAAGREVLVIPSGDDDPARSRSLELWSDVDLSADWQSLEWIDEPGGQPPRG